MATALRTARPFEEVIESNRPRLVVAQRGSRVMWLIVFGAGTVFALLLFATMLRVVLAEQQLKLDGMTKSVAMARDHYNDLRHERTFLLSPERLSAEAARLGMRPAGQSRFVAINPEILAVVAAATGDLTDHLAKEESSLLDEFGRIKSEVRLVP